MNTKIKKKKNREELVLYAHALCVQQLHVYAAVVQYTRPRL